MDQAAAELGLEPIAREEVATVLRLARDVAHGLERRAAPVAAYLAGLAAGATGGVASRATALAEAARTLTGSIPPQDQGEPGPPAG
jgi:hypothetical protein